MWSLLLGCALAAELADPSPGALFPGAAEMEAGTVRVGVGGGVMPVPQYWVDGVAFGVFAHLDAAPVRGMVVEASVGPALLYSAHQDGMAVGSLALRQNVVQGPSFNLGLFAGGLLYGGPGAGLSVNGAAGLALEGGGRVRWDFSLPLVLRDGTFTRAEDAWVYPGDDATAALFLLAEAGVTVPVGERDWLRFGKDAGGVGVAWWRRWERQELELRASTLVFLSTLSARWTVALGRGKRAPA